MKEMVKETIIPMTVMLVFGVCFGMVIKQKEVEHYKNKLNERDNVQIQCDRDEKR